MLWICHFNSVALRLLSSIYKKYCTKISFTFTKRRLNNIIVCMFFQSKQLFLAKNKREAFKHSRDSQMQPFESPFFLLVSHNFVICTLEPTLCRPHCLRCERWTTMSSNITSMEINSKENRDVGSPRVLLNLHIYYDRYSSTTAISKLGFVSPKVC